MIDWNKVKWLRNLNNNGYTSKGKKNLEKIYPEASKEDIDQLIAEMKNYEDFLRSE